METIVPVERTLTRIDHLRLTRLLASERGPSAAHATMQEVLDNSSLVASQAVAATAVTMGSHVLLQDPERDAPPYQVALCYPDQAAPSAGAVSVLSPLGTALLGLHVGELARWRKPDGSWGAARILSLLYQPEASGDFQS